MSAEYDDFNDELNEEQEEANSSLFLEILDEQEVVSVDQEPIRLVCQQILADAGIVYGRIGIVLVDNETIHNLNRDFLKHDYPTDVISFQIESDRESGLLEGEVIVSVEMAQSRASEFQWSGKEEMLLYVIHGLLHLVGFDDIQEPERGIMREKERYYLRHIGIEPNNLGFEEEQSENSEQTDSVPAKQDHQDSLPNLILPQHPDQNAPEEDPDNPNTPFYLLIDNDVEKN